VVQIKNDRDKMTGEERRKYILQWLQASTESITGSVLADRTKVSRQVIVQDISLLKAKNEPIIATAQGYYFMQQSNDQKVRRVIACCHPPEQTEHELNIMVDQGATVLDVIVEHPIYGEIKAALMLRNRRDVSHFLGQIKETKASLLSELTEGIHLHTIEAETVEQLDEICEALDRAGYLLSSR
jgi:transcriptional regulator of NAD metabolism